MPAKLRVARVKRPFKSKAVPAHLPEIQPTTELKSISETAMIVITSSDETRLYTAEHQLRELDQVAIIEAIKANPRLAQGNPKSTYEAVDRLLNLHLGKTR